MCEILPQESVWRIQGVCVVVGVVGEEKKMCDADARDLCRLTALPLWGQQSVGMGSLNEDSV